MDVAVKPMKPDDWEAVRAIYAEGISTGNATFERESPHWQSWDAGHLRECRLIARSGSDIIGWVALSAVSERLVEENALVRWQARGVTSSSSNVGATESGYDPDNRAGGRPRPWARKDEIRVCEPVLPVSLLFDIGFGYNPPLCGVGWRGV